MIYHGRLKPWVGGKDIILSTIGDIGTDGALYRAIEFQGEALSQLSMEQRFTMTNMTIEAGGKAGLMVPDATTLGYVRARAKREWQVYEPDPDAEYVEEHEYDVSDLEPMVALPFSPDNVVPLSKAPRRGDRPGVHRLLHQRAALGPAPGRPDHGGAPGAPAGALHGDPGLERRLPGGPEGGPAHHLRRGGLRGIYVHLRALPGRLHGRPGRGRALRQHQQPQLPGPHGPPQGGGLSGQPGGGRRQRHRRPAGGPGGGGRDEPIAVASTSSAPTSIPTSSSRPAT